MRRLTRLATGLAGLGILAASASAQNLIVEKLAGGLASPVDIASPPGDARIFVCEQNTGDLEIVHPNGTVTKFLDITGKVSTGGERGLLGVAFHPDYANNGRFFINYTRNNGNTRVEEYAVDPGNPDLADPNPVQTILIVPQPFSNHNGGCIRFGGDGMLYIGTGDGGSGNDPGNRAQDGQELLGKILRLDVDLPSPFIPADNPFVGDPNVLDEIWALGIRNPWRFSFDSQNGDLWIGDVGQNAREEIHWAPGTSTGGENYGWRCMEGFNCTGLSGCTCNGSALTDPAHDYTHGAGRCSVTGGIAYRGPIAGLQGTYFFADWCNGQIWSFDWDGASMSNFTERTAELEPPGADTIQSPVAFGEDVDGNMLILDHNGGELYVVLEDCAGPTNYCVTTANSETAGALISASGSVSLSANDMVLHASASVSNEFGLFFFGPQQQQVPAGNGTLCVDGGLVRIVPPSQADGNGMASRALNFNMSPTDNFSPGETMYFQWWYRDPSVGTGSNFSDGLCVTFCP